MSFTLLCFSGHLAAAGHAFAGPVCEPWDAALDGGQLLGGGRPLRRAALRPAGALLAPCTSQQLSASVLQ